MAYFKLNQIDSEARNYLYSEIPIHSTFDEKLNTWNRRKKIKKPIFSRMYLVNPKDRQRYFIRLLLLHNKGATSFENLRTFNSVIHPTFYEAAV